MTNDEETLVRILASARAEQRGTSMKVERDFAEKFLCLLFDPAKAKYPEHQAAGGGVAPHLSGDCELTVTSGYVSREPPAGAPLRALTR